MKQFKTTDVFTTAEHVLAATLDINDIVTTIVAPKMRQVDAITGQENDKKFIGYLLQFEAWRASKQLEVQHGEN